MLERPFENFVGKGENAGNQHFLLFHKVFSSTGHRPVSLCHGPLSVVHPSMHLSVRALTFSLKIFFSETTHWILMKFHRNGPAMVLFRIFFLNNLIPSRTLVTMATILNFFFKSLNIFLSETIRPIELPNLACSFT